MGRSEIWHVFNSTLVSGPETLVLPNLAEARDSFPWPIRILLLQETRNSDGAEGVATYARNLGFPVLEIPVEGRWDRRACRAFAQLIEQHDPLALHAHGPKASLFAAQALSKIPTTPRPSLFTTHHGVRANDQSFKLKLFESAYERLAMPACAGIFTVCSSDLSLLAKRGVPQHRLRVHLNGTTRPEISVPQRERIRRQQRQLWQNRWPEWSGWSFSEAPHSEQSPLLLGVAARLAPEKRYDLLLEALHLLAPSWRGRLGIIAFGSGPLKEPLLEKRRRLGLENQIYFAGYQSQVFQVFPALDGLLSLSSAEGLPINLVEAGYSRLPVMATIVDGVADLMGSDKPLAPPGQPQWTAYGMALPAQLNAPYLAQALVQWIETQSQLPSLGSNFCDHVVSHFSGSTWTRRLESLYSDFGVLKPNIGCQGSTDLALKS